jgi:hypothetical protein
MQRLDVYGAIDFSALAAIFAGMRAYATEYACQRRSLVYQAECLVHLTLGQQGDKPLHLYAERTRCTAGSNPILLYVIR